MAQLKPWLPTGMIIQRLEEANAEIPSMKTRGPAAKDASAFGIPHEKIEKWLEAGGSVTNRELVRFLELSFGNPYMRGAEFYLGSPLQEIEQEYIRRTIEFADGNKARASEMLGVPRRTLYGKLERYDARHKSNGRPNGSGHRAPRDGRDGLT